MITTEIGIDPYDRNVIKGNLEFTEAGCVVFVPSEKDDENEARFVFRYKPKEDNEQQAFDNKQV